MELHRCINFLLSSAQHTVFQYLSDKLSPYSITPGQYGMLSCLWANGQLSPKQIGELLGLEASSVSSSLDRMQKAGLINRDIDPDDRRNILVSATQKGKDLQEPVEQIIAEMNRRVLEPFGPGEQEVLLTTLLTIARRKLKEEEDPDGN